MPLRGDHLDLNPARRDLSELTRRRTSSTFWKLQEPARRPTYAARDKWGCTTHLCKWGKLSQKTEDYHILIKRSHSTSSGSAQPTRQRDAALACISQAPLSSETFTPIKVKLVLPPSQYPTRADLTTIPMTEVEELLPGGNRRQSRREGDYLSFSYTHTKLRVRSRENY